MTVKILQGDCRAVLAGLPDGSVNTVVTSPPYFGLRDYDHADQLGMEETPEQFVQHLVQVFREVRRILRDDGTVWLNLGDSYAGSWGAQSREHAGKHAPNVSALSANQVKAAARKRSGTGRIPPGSGLKPKDLIGIPWMVAFALRADGWWLRQDIIWHKPNRMPESMKDRCTKAHEYLFLLSKSDRYYFDQEAIAEGLETDPSERYEQRAKATGRAGQGAAAARGGDRDKSGGFPPSKRFSFARKTKSSAGEHGQKPQHRPDREDVYYVGRRNKRSVWTVQTQPFPEAHFATFPPALIEPCILAGCPKGGVVLDPFGGAGTTGLVAERLGRDSVLVELNPKYIRIANRRLRAGLAKVEATVPEENHHGPLFGQPDDEEPGGPRTTPLNTCAA